ncbi:MAG: heavy-metal-associated domain-containing protein [Candidatus Vogelbacteria bacterium]|nr:heavy-metal-associated domain-containing protein [Candidatus Vogelbacteria bacterium]
MMEKLEMKIAGMHCGACATGIQMIVSGLDGVKSVFVDYDKKAGTVAFEPTKVTKEQIFAAVAELGYTATA